MQRITAKDMARCWRLASPPPPHWSCRLNNGRAHVPRGGHGYPHHCDRRRNPCSRDGRLGRAGPNRL